MPRGLFSNLDQVGNRSRKEGEGAFEGKEKRGKNKLKLDWKGAKWSKGRRIDGEGGGSRSGRKVRKDGFSGGGHAAKK